ncbi:stage II sporulation protein M [Candidatus Bathyarchaeota archaeon]|nr:stage II sporulation protein M [Candidatus Bathyarchaeota archaeon]
MTGALSSLFGRDTEYVRSLKGPFAICSLLFIFSLASGFYLGESMPGGLLEELIQPFPELKGMSLPSIFLFILANNVLKSLVWMVLGILFGIPPLIFTAFNGFFLGWFSYSISRERGIMFTLAALVPHGVVEIPAILLSMAAGLGIGYQFINRLRGRGRVGAEVKGALKLFVRRIVPLLLLAALIEVLFTPLVVYLLGLV